jgi:hypothetical protein
MSRQVIACLVALYRIYWHISHPPCGPCETNDLSQEEGAYSKGIYYVDGLCAIQMLLGRDSDPSPGGGLYATGLIAKGGGGGVPVDTVVGCSVVGCSVEKPCGIRLLWLGRRKAPDLTSNAGIIAISSTKIRIRNRV